MRRGIEADQSLYPTLPEQTVQELAFSTTEIGDGLAALCAKCVDHGSQTLIVESDRRLKRIFRRTSRLDSFLPRLRRQTLQCHPSEHAAVTKIATHDQFLFRMAVEPACGRASLHRA